MTDILMRPVIALQIAVHELREREDGQTTTEYAILLGFLAIAIIVALFFLRNVLRGLFSDAASSVFERPWAAVVQPRNDGRPAFAGGRLSSWISTPCADRRSTRRRPCAGLSGT